MQVRTCIGIGISVVFVIIGHIQTVNAGEVLLGPIVNPYNKHTYYYLARDGWENSQLDGQALGGNLVTIDDQAENDWLLATFPGTASELEGGGQDFWIGLSDSDSEGHFTWISGANVAYENWAPGEPNNAGGNEDVAQFLTRDIAGYPAGSWNDIPIAQLRPAVIEIVPEPATVLVLGVASMLIYARRST